MLAASSTKLSAPMSKRPPERTMGGSCSNYLHMSRTPDAPSKVPATDGSYDKAVVDQPSISSAAVSNAPHAEKRLRTSNDSTSSSSKPERQVRDLGEPVVSVASVENVRYSLVDAPQPDHWNEDARFVINDQPRFKVMAVFDGHDGSNAVEHVCTHFHNLFSRQFLHEVKEQDVGKVLEKFFESAEYSFFHHIQVFIAEKKALQSRIPEVSL